MKRINAFTLTELIVVMIITSIVFIIAFYALRTVTIFQLSQGKINNDAGEYRVLNKLMIADFLSSYRSEQKEERILIHSSIQYGTIAYYFGDTYITRTIESGMCDTFHIKMSNSIPSIKYLIPEDRLISELELPIIFHEQPITLHYEKLYSPEIIINKEIESLKNELH